MFSPARTAPTAQPPKLRPTTVTANCDSIPRAERKTTLFFLRPRVSFGKKLATVYLFCLLPFVAFVDWRSFSRLIRIMRRWSYALAG